MSIHSSWNPDRIAAASMAGKSHAPRRIYKRPTVQVTKESDLYIGDYGEQAYYEWKHREAAIDAMWSSGRYAASEIVKMREDNLRRMKAAGAARGQELPVARCPYSRPYVPAA
jgi:hypothetical protein